VEIATVLSSISMMGIIIIFGFLIGKTFPVTEGSKQLLVIIIINIAVPSIILNGIFNIEMNDQLLLKMLNLFVISILFNAIGIGVGWISAVLFGLRSMNARKLAVLAGIGNTGFIGIPVCTSLFGPSGGLLAAIFDAGLDIIVFTLVIVLLNKDGRFSLSGLKAMLNIPIIAIVVGISIAISGYEPPSLIKNLAAALANLAAPLAMLYIGLLISSFIKGKKVPLRFISISLLMKLLVFPFIIIAILQAIPVTADLKLIALVQVSMPTFMLAAILFARYGQDEDTAVMTTVYSTIFSLITIPLIVYIAT
jgi:malate permease and related proteins